jgi:hypothetical protein
LILSACCASVTPDPIQVNIPPPVNYPVVKAPELECLSESTYEKLVVRDVRCRERVKTLEDIIKSTQEIK